MDKATSNICTSQALLAVVASFYAVWHGKLGLRAVAEKVQKDTQTFLTAMGESADQPLWGSVAVRLPSNRRASGIQSILQSKHNLGVGVLNEHTLSVSFDETTGVEDIQRLAEVLKFKLDHYKVEGTLHDPMSRATARLQLRNTDSFLNQEIFNKYPTEHEMLRYITQLQSKDLSLAHSMITLGSCTMKLNPTTTLLPLSWPELQHLHPFGPEQRLAKYKEILLKLKRHLTEITRMDGCSLQPLSGAMGEYTGLLAIKKYLNDPRRRVCLIPRSAHGTNAASAAMMNYQVLWVDDREGINVENFKKTCESVKDELACLMVTYPSTYGVFDEHISELIEAVHANGGQVYMDGANMNAQLGLTAPGHIGADVVHLNLHKTFAIPHGGGGPGMGPICVKKHLIPFLPDDEAVDSDVAVSSSTFGQAGIGVIPYFFIEMLGGTGLKQCGTFAVFNANYMMEKLKPHYPVKATNEHGRCSHEFIIQVSQFKQTAGVTEEDIAKRLMDYGFHAPTMSWPVPGSLMIEPTESESKEELDRFCDAMISIRKEISLIENGELDKVDNPLKNAPHTLEATVSDDWKHKYSREMAAFPLPWIRARGKFWPSVARVSNVLGDKHLKLKLNK